MRRGFVEKEKSLIAAFDHSFRLLIECLHIISRSHTQFYADETATVIKYFIALHQIIVKMQINCSEIQLSELSEPKERLAHATYVKIV